MGLVETWVEEKDWETLRKKMPKEYEWKCQFARRISKKGRAKGGIVTRIRRTMKEVKAKEEEKEEEGIQERKVEVGEQIWRMITVYSNEEMKTKRKQLNERIEETEEGVFWLGGGGDFNARIGRRGNRYEGEDDEQSERETKDDTKNGEGNELIDLIEERGWRIMNGNVKGDEDGQWTYSGGRGASVVDYAITNEEGWEKAMEMKVGERIESDHQTLEIRAKGKISREKKERTKRKKEVIDWSEMGIAEYKRKEEEQWIAGEGNEEKWAQLKAGIRDSMEKKWIKIKSITAGDKCWCDREGRKEKEKVAKTYRREKREGAKRSVCGSKERRENDVQDERKAEARTARSRN